MARRWRMNQKQRRAARVESDGRRVMPETQSTRRLRVAAVGAAGVGRRHLRPADLAAGDPSRRAAAAGRAATAEDGGNRRRCAGPSSIAPASRWPRPCRPNPSASIRMKIPDRGRGRGSAFAHSGSEADAAVSNGIAHGQGAQQRIPVGEAQSRSAEEAERLRSLKLDWVEFRPEMRRFYPHGDAGVARAGLHRHCGSRRCDRARQRRHRDELSTMIWRDARAWRACITDVRQNAYDSVVIAGAGAGLESDADHRSESAIRSRAGTGQRRSRQASAKTGSIVALNPYTGDILAMANYPRLRSERPPEPRTRRRARAAIWRFRRRSSPAACSRWSRLRRRSKPPT